MTVIPAPLTGYTASAALSRLEGLLTGAADYVNRLESAAYEIKDIADSLKSGITIDTDSPEERIDEIEERLSVISRLKRKYRTDEEGLIERLKELKSEKQLLDSSDEALQDKINELKAVEGRLSILAEDLSKKRKEAANNLEREIEEHLAGLDMPSVTFVTKFEKIPIPPREPILPNSISRPIRGGTTHFKIPGGELSG